MTLGMTMTLYPSVQIMLLPQLSKEHAPWPQHAVVISPVYEQGSLAMAPHSSTLAWKIPWTEEPVRLQSMGSLRVGHD